MTYVLGAVADLSPAKKLQTELKRVGFYSGAIDGIIGKGSISGCAKWTRAVLDMIATWATALKGTAGDVWSGPLATFAQNSRPKVDAAESQRDLPSLEKIRANAAQLMQSAVRDTGVTMSPAGKAFLSVSFNVPSSSAGGSGPPASDSSPPTVDPTIPDTSGGGLPGGNITLPIVGSVPVLALVAAVGVAGFILTRK